MSGRVEQMRQELISNGVNPEIVNNMSEKQLEAACRWKQRAENAIFKSSQD